MSHRRNVEEAILAGTYHPRQVGELYARACKLLGEYDNDELRSRLFARVSGSGGETRRARRRRTRKQPGDSR